ncbi:phosphoinositide phosphatase SAC4-like [Olea europaea var. sylvestris]|uniref:phosphoinositide phosphatase SAC4-like n=1 Tax=Olea europaea var. sylvestris TaxID=158386 RepID=UPI000C1D2A2E|nr:phosphoinositide phosphatase SAC4-like [Olea europaea var. sylvestris]
MDHFTLKLAISLFCYLASKLSCFRSIIPYPYYLSFLAIEIVNMIFSERRGQWKAAIQSQEFFRTLQRYYSNAYMDAEKQNAINVFLGDFLPQPGKPDVWELDSDQHYNVGRYGQSNIDENGRLLFKRSWSDGNILSESHSPTSTSKSNMGFSSAGLSDKPKRECKMLSESTPVISASESDVTCSRYTPSVPSVELRAEMQRDGCLEHENVDTIDCSNFVDLDWLSSGTSCEEESLERYSYLESLEFLFSLRYYG